MEGFFSVSFLHSSSYLVMAIFFTLGKSDGLEMGLTPQSTPLIWKVITLKLVIVLT